MESCDLPAEMWEKIAITFLQDFPVTPEVVLVGHWRLYLHTKGGEGPGGRVLGAHSDCKSWGFFARHWDVWPKEVQHDVQQQAIKARTMRDVMLLQCHGYYNDLGGFSGSHPTTLKPEHCEVVVQAVARHLVVSIKRPLAVLGTLSRNARVGTTTRRIGTMLGQRLWHTNVHRGMAGQ